MNVNNRNIADDLAAAERPISGLDVDANEELAQWQSSDAGKMESNIHCLSMIADDFTDAWKTREGVKVLLSDWQKFLDAKRKLDDIEYEMRQTLTWRHGVIAI